LDHIVARVTEDHVAIMTFDTIVAFIPLGFPANVIACDVA
jgi:hypothetical protein